MNFGCGMGTANNMPLSPALARLKEEHIPLRAQMDEFYMLAKDIGADDSVDNWADALRNLQEKAVSFMNELDPHSIREEDVLFPMMAKYIGREMGPIAVMEYEHDQAKKNLKQFTEKMDQIQGTVGKEEAKGIAAHLMNAYVILTEHFMKEENVLFPMAQQMLTEEEKEELVRKFNEIA